MYVSYIIRDVHYGYIFMTHVTAAHDSLKHFKVGFLGIDYNIVELRKFRPPHCLKANH